MRAVSAAIRWSLVAAAVAVHLGPAPMNIAFALVVVVALFQRPSLRPTRRVWFVCGGFCVAALIHVAVGTEAPLRTEWTVRWRHVLIVPLVTTMLAALSEDEAVRTKRSVIIAFVSVAAASALYGSIQTVFETPGVLQRFHRHAVVLPRLHRASETFWFFGTAGTVRASGFVHNVLAFAHLSMLACLVALGAAFESEKMTTRLRWVAAATLIAVAMYLSFARAALLALGIGVAAQIAARVIPKPRAVLAAALATLIAAWIVLFTSFSATPERLSHRPALWKAGLEAVIDTAPRGTGYGSYPTRAQRVYPEHPVLERAVRTWCHNSWVSLAAEAPLTLLFVVWAIFCGLSATVRFSSSGLGLVVGLFVLTLFHDPHFQREVFPATMLLVAITVTGNQLWKTHPE